jgi:alkaline phosphatase D
MRLFFCFVIMWVTVPGIYAQPDYRIALLGCHKQFEPAPALSKYLEAEPDLCLWIGDNIYADTETDITFVERCYAALAAKPAFQQLYERYPLAATWDDHDFGLNDAGKEYALKEQTKALFREFWGLEEKIPAERDGIYYAEYIPVGEKVLQLIMLDVRYNRDEPQTDGDVLGEPQWAWLENELKQPADLRLISSGFQILLDERAGSETWAKFPSARERLFNLIRTSKAENVIFYTGDQHYGEVNRLSGALDFDAIELQFAGINQIEDPEWNPLRVANAITSKHSYALLDLYFSESKSEVPHIHFQVFNAMTDDREISYRVNLRELQLTPDFDGAFAFVGQGEAKLGNPYPNLSLRYTTNGEEPSASAPIYQQPIVMDRTTTVKAQFFTSEGQPRSKVFEQKYERLSPKAALSLDRINEGLRYKYYEGKFDRLDDLMKTEVVESGVAVSLDLEKLAKQEDHFGLVFEGLIKVPSSGVYTFYTISDDGSRLYIGDQLVVDNDGSHNTRQRSGLAVLEKGYHPIKIEYFEDYSGEQLVVKWKEQGGMVKVLGQGDFYHE